MSDSSNPMDNQDVKDICKKRFIIGIDSMVMEAEKSHSLISASWRFMNADDRILSESSG